jgi:hypothetical protein
MIVIIRLGRIIQFLYLVSSPQASRRGDTIKSGNDTNKNVDAFESIHPTLTVNVRSLYN